MIEIIKILYPQIKKKTEFKIYAAAIFDKSPATINSPWLGGFWRVPKEHQSKMIEIMRTWINDKK